VNVSVRRHHLPALVLALGALALYLRTAAPSVATLFDDSLEFQVVIPLLGVPHPPGYPLYVLLGKLWTLILPWRDPAWRLNVFSAFSAALALIPLYGLAYHLHPRHRHVGVAVGLLALAPTFWSQATIAEVYALHLLLSAALLNLGAQILAEQARRPRRLYVLALLLGLSLAHHRMTLLLLPALAYWLWSLRHDLPREPRFWGKVALLLAFPLLLYLYIPLVGARVGSLDGTYVNTWTGFWNWVQARAYRVFLTGNPFNVHRGAMDYVRLFLREMGGPALVLALVGMARTRRSDATRVGLLLALLAQLGFVVEYKVADIEVFYLPLLLLTVPFIAVGLGFLEDGGRYLLGRMAPRPGRALSWLVPLWSSALLALTLYPAVHEAVAHWQVHDRSDDWQVYNLGTDIMHQPLPQGSAIIGILGETTLVRYFRDVLGQRPDLQVIPADREAERLAAIARTLNAGRTAFITRPLPGAPERYTLDAVGPLIRVRLPSQDDRPRPAHVLKRTFTPAITLAGYTLQRPAFHGRSVLRLVLYWDVQARPREDYKVSARLLRPNGRVAVAVDDVPVHNTYPTRDWRPGERVQDVYDLPWPSGPVRSLRVILYRAANGAEVGRVTLSTTP